MTRVTVVRNEAGMKRKEASSPGTRGGGCNCWECELSDAPTLLSGRVRLRALVHDLGQPGDLVEARRVTWGDVLRDGVDRAAPPPGDPDSALVLPGPDLGQRLIAKTDR